ncbi:MAG: hypothetical protein R3E10_07045 [Gemmatimonadota bacterium]
MKALLIGTLLGATLGFVPARQDPTPAQATQPIAVIVHPDNPVDGFTLEELRRLYLGNTTLFANRERVILLESAEERGRFYRTVAGMGEDRLKRHWVARVFAGDSGTPPIEFRSPEDLKHYVATHPGAVAFLPAAAVDRSVKAVPIDGRRPGDARYPIP